MLPKSSRLNLKTSFKWVRSGRSLDDKYARIFIKEGNNQTAKIGISTSSKVFKSAVDRNRSRRLISKAIEGLVDKLPSNLNVIFLPKEIVIKSSSDEVYTSLKETLGVKS